MLSIINFTLFWTFSVAYKNFHCLTLRGTPHFGEKEPIMRVENEGNATRTGQGSGKHSLFVVLASILYLWWSSNLSFSVCLFQYWKLFIKLFIKRLFQIIRFKHSLFVIELKPQLTKSAFLFSVFFNIVNYKEIECPGLWSVLITRFCSDVTMCQTFSAKFGKRQSDVYQWQLSPAGSVWGPNLSWWCAPPVDLTRRQWRGRREDPCCGELQLRKHLGHRERLIDLLLPISGLWPVCFDYPFGNICWRHDTSVIHFIPIYCSHPSIATH